jgi:hypothetical protein
VAFDPRVAPIKGCPLSADGTKYYLSAELIFTRGKLARLYLVGNSIFSEISKSSKEARFPAID